MNLKRFKTNYLYSYKSLGYRVIIECMYALPDTIRFKDIQVVSDPDQGVGLSPTPNKTLWTPDISILQNIKTIGPKENYPEYFL